MSFTSRALVAASGSAVLVLSCLGIAQASGGTTAPGPSKPRVAAAAAPARHLTVASSGLNETVFTPITPCRIVDTRLAGGLIGTAGRSFYVGGTANFPAQGGTSGGCAIPTSATAVSANLVAVDGTFLGYLKAYPAGAAAPSASVLNYAKTSAIANGVPLSILPGAGRALTVTASTSADVVIDITGYYQQPIAAFISSAGAIYSSTLRVLSVNHAPGSGVYGITVDSSVQTCVATAVTTGSGRYVSADSAGTGVTVNTWSLGANAQPVATDYAFLLSVTC